MDDDLEELWREY